MMSPEFVFKRKRLCIDINSIVSFLLFGKTTGVGRTTKALIYALAYIKDQIPFDIILYSQNMKGVGSKSFQHNFNAKHLYLPNSEFVNKWFNHLPIKETFCHYDLLHIPHNYEYIFRPEKTIITLHDAIFMHIIDKEFEHFQLVMREKVPSLMHQCKGIITPSEASKLDIVNSMDINPNKIDVVPWGIDHEIFYPQEDKNLVRKIISKQFGISKPFFLSVSCNADRKKTHKLVEAYLRLAKQCPVNDLILIWRNPPVFVLKMIEQSRMNHRIHFLSNIPDHFLSVLYNGATAFIFPSSHEGFGLPILEAMACGTPVVTCWNSSLPEIGGDAALYMNEPTLDNIFDFLECFENNRWDTTQLFNQGIKQASKFHWEKAALKYLNIYKRYLNIL